MKEFSVLAQYYDRFVGADYDEIINFIDENIKRYLPEASLVCDIGCGSGTVMLGLLEKGYDMIGIDGSIEMLSEAQNKKAALSNADKALFLYQQLPDFELYGTVDCIVSTLDTVNYLSEPGDVERLFHWFFNYLNPQGLLIFDINTLYKYQKILNGNCEVYEDEDIFLAWRSHFENDLCSHYVTVFKKDGDVYLRDDEEQLQRYYSELQIMSLLEKNHFELLHIYDGYGRKLPEADTQRLTFVARKKDLGL